MLSHDCLLVTPYFAVECLNLTRLSQLIGDGLFELGELGQFFALQLRGPQAAILLRVDADLATDELEMEVRTRGATCAADFANEIPLSERLPFLHRDPAQMAIRCLEAIGVPNPDVKAIGSSSLCGDYSAIGCGIDV